MNKLPIQLVQLVGRVSKRYAQFKKLPTKELKLFSFI